MTKLGKIIYNALQKRGPILINGTRPDYSKMKLSLQNPYLLEALPENSLHSLSWIEGKKAGTVCRILDTPDCSKIIERYKKFCIRNSAKGFSNIELKNLYKKAFNGHIPHDPNCDALVFVNTIPTEIASQFDAHGIAKGLVTDHLVSLNKILSEGIDKSRNFHTAPLLAKTQGVGAGLGTSGSAYKDGSFILVSGKSKRLEDGIETVIVNDAYYKIIDDLRQRFNGINFVKAEDVAEYFTKL